MDNNNELQLDFFLENLSVLANILQVGSFIMNQEQISNDEIMKALERQNQIYLAEILETQKEILEKLNRLL